LFGACVVYLFLYESSDISLEAVDMMYNDPTCKPWTSRTWAPPGYSSRADLIEQSRAAESRKPVAEVEHVEKAGEPSGRNGFHDTENGNLKH
jgi:SP family sugar:H+ symporter-like MFS transporter